jgi:hypothetical protein
MSDASLLACQSGFVVPKDPMWLSTLDAIDRTWFRRLVYALQPPAHARWVARLGGDFFHLFVLRRCTGPSRSAGQGSLHLEKMLTYANHPLYSEEIGPTGEQLGNFPPSHLSLIGAAVFSTTNSATVQRTN